MNIYDVNFASELQKNKVVYEKNTTSRNSLSKEITIEFSNEEIKLRIVTNTIRNTRILPLLIR